MRESSFLPLALALAAALTAGGCSPEKEPAGSEAESAAEPRATPRPAPAAPGFPLADVTAASGVDFVHDAGADGRHHYVETMSPGVALFDADGDGDLDLYAVNGAPLPGSPPRTSTNHLYRNRGAGADGIVTFDDVTEGSGAADEAYGMGVAVADVEGDGDLDLYLLNYGPNALYLNDGAGRFERVEAGVEDETWSVAGAFFDADGDGDLDLYNVDYLRYDVQVEKPCKAGTLEIYCSPEQYPPTPDRLYRNDGAAGGRVRFTEISAAAGVAADGRGMGVGVGDFDDDGDQDLYITNDRSQNLLYKNEGGRLREIAAEAGVGYSQTGQAEGGMGVAIGDYAGDGRAAIFFTNFQKEPNRLFVPAFGEFYDDRSAMSGLAFPSTEMVAWGIGSFDLEGDGDLDLAVGNGHVFENAEAFIPGSAHALPDHLYVNDGGGRFALEEFPGEPLSSRGIAAGDLDGDGDPDLVIMSCGGPLRVWRNDAGRPERYLLLRLEAPAPNTHAYGARVMATAGGRTQRREVSDGGSYASHSDTRVYLGLGGAAAVERIEVRWPDGSVEEAADVAGGQEVVWRQGEGIVERLPLGDPG